MDEQQVGRLIASVTWCIRTFRPQLGGSQAQSWKSFLHIIDQGIMGVCDSELFALIQERRGHVERFLREGAEAGNDERSHATNALSYALSLKEEVPGAKFEMPNASSSSWFTFQSGSLSLVYSSTEYLSNQVGLRVQLLELFRAGEDAKEEVVPEEIVRQAGYQHHFGTAHLKCYTPPGTGKTTWLRKVQITQPGKHHGCVVRFWRNLNVATGAASGLKWRKVDSPPPDGQQLVNKDLSKALKNERFEFTSEQWDSFGIGAVRMDHYVEVKAWFGLQTAYFKPDDFRKEVLDDQLVKVRRTTPLRGRS